MAKKKNDERTFVTYKDFEEAEQKYNLNYLIVYGGRGDGKSYAAKEKVLRDFFRDGSMFTYLRRYDVDIKTVDNSLYWADFMSGHPNKIEELSGKAWSGIQCEKAVFYLTCQDPKGETQRGPAIGYIHALSTSEKRLKSLQFPEVKTIIYEEFCTSDTPLYNEVRIFNNYVSTVIRDRRGSVYMIGNTVSRHNPFFREWEMVGIPKQEPGTVDVYTYNYEGTDIRVGAYYTKAHKINQMFFGDAAKLITGSSWDSKEQPHLEGKEEDYTELYRIYIQIDKSNKYMCRFMVKDDIAVWYVTPKTTDIKLIDRIISPQYVPSMLYTQGLQPINDKERRIFPYFNLGRIVYSDNLTGTEFKRGLLQLAALTSGKE